ncbi:MAG: hypothetical protein HRF49_10585 [bacterium]|jgi:hypothetical protein
MIRHIGKRIAVILRAMLRKPKSISLFAILRLLGVAAKAIVKKFWIILAEEAALRVGVEVVKAVVDVADAEKENGAGVAKEEK